MNNPQKYERRDPFPQLPFHCEEEEGLPSGYECLVWGLTVALLTVIFCEVLG